MKLAQIGLFALLLSSTAILSSSRVLADFSTKPEVLPTGVTVTPSVPRNSQFEPLNPGLPAVIAQLYRWSGGNDSRQSG